MKNNEEVKTPRRGMMGGGPMMGLTDKPKDFRSSVRKLFTYFKTYMPLVVVALLLAIVSTIFTIIGPDKVSDITNEITKGIMTGINMDKVKSIALFLAIIYLLSAVLSYIQTYIMTEVTNRFAKNMRKEISLKINRMPLKYFDTHTFGDILSRVTNDVDTIGQTLNQSIASLVSGIVLFLGVILMMFITNSIMAITSIMASIIGFLLMSIILKNSQKYFVIQQNELGKINGHIEETYSGLNVVKVYNGVNLSNKKFDEINEKLYTSTKKSQFLAGLMPPIMGFIGNFGYVCVCIVGAMLVINGSITIGVIVSFMIYVRLFTSPLSTIAQATTRLQSAAAASERVFEFLEEKEMDDENKKTSVLKKEDVKGNVEFQNVKFGYDPNKTIIKNFNASIKAGQNIAIVGPTGAGKTTLVNLLMRFYDNYEGKILIDGIDTKELTRENIHDLFCMVLQDTWVFDGTIKDNIIYNKKGIKKEDVINACKVVGLDHYIKSLPDGYDTVLSDNDTLSAGQKQLLTVARAMIEDAPLLILDEATSSVDTRTETLVQKSMDKLMERKTSFVIAHRLSTIKNADLILVIKNGNIEEMGTHKELLKKKGFYSELYNSQFS